MGNSVAHKMRPNSGRLLPAGSLYTKAGARKYLSRGERDRALAATAQLDPRQALFALMLAWTGARVSEALALCPASFQLDRNVVAIVTLKRRRHSVRELPIPPALMRALVSEFALADAQRDSVRAVGRLWPWHRSTAWRYVKALMSSAGVVGVAACPRGFRHGFGVATLQSSVPINLVQRWMGHARLSTTAIYTDAVGPEELAFAARFWAEGESP